MQLWKHLSLNLVRLAWRNVDDEEWGERDARGGGERRPRDLIIGV